MARGNLVAGQPRPCPRPLPNELTPRPNDELVELVWNNGQIVMQAQSNINLIRDDEMLPWIGSPTDYPLPRGYGYEQFSETSGVTSNGMSNRNSFLSVDKSSSDLTVGNFQSGGNDLNGSSSEAHPMMRSWLSQQSQTLDAIVSGVSESNNKFINQAEDRVSEEQKHHLKRKPVEVESECRSDDMENELVGAKKHIATRGGNGPKRNRAAEVHNLSERRRRDRINEKMRSLQELIPNCNKSDKASLLDEAIEYLKNLQLQIKMMSAMGAQFFPPGMHYMHPAHYSAMGVGMGMNMGYGMRMMDMSAGASPGCPPIYPVPPMRNPSPNFPRIPGQNLPVYGRGLTGSGQNPPLSPLPGRPIPLGALRNEAPNTSLICNAEAGTSTTYNPNQSGARNEVMNQSAVNVQETNAIPYAPADIGKGPGCV